MAITRVLVVDDSEVHRRLVCGLLQKNLGCEFEMCENGIQALNCLEREPFDVVLTDLVMPEMDGLRLVRAARERWPQIPVVLMTAFGNETIAVDALHAGAASYVPKSHLAARLLDTVERVLRHAEADRRRGKLSHCVLEYGWRLALDNDPELVRALVDQVQEMMAGVAFGDVGERIRVCEALEEALLNAMYHGNLEIAEHELAEARDDLSGSRLKRLLELRRGQPECRDRRTLVIVQVSTVEARFVIRDEGRGFHVASVAGVDSAKAFGHGQRRGLTLIQSIMDEVSFNDSGNELTLCKRRLTPITAHQIQRA